MLTMRQERMFHIAETKPNSREVIANRIKAQLILSATVSLNSLNLNHGQFIETVKR